MKCLLIVFTALVVCGFAYCDRYTVHVSNSQELSDALKNARPGADIKLAPGTYKGSYNVTNSGEPDCEINIDGNNEVTLTTSQHKLFDFTNASYIVLMNVEISHITGPDPIGVYIYRSNNIIVSGVKFSSLESAVSIEKSNWCSVDTCVFNDIVLCVDIGYKDECSGNSVKNCQFQDGLTDVFVYLWSGATNNQVTGNEFIGKEVCSSDTWIRVEGSNNLIQNNYFKYKVYDSVANRYLRAVYCKGTENIYRDNTIIVINAGLGVGFYNQGTNEHICVSNNVTGVDFTNGDIDKSC